MTTLIDEACWERGCPCHDDRESKGVAVVRREWVGLTDEEVNEIYEQTEQKVWKHWEDGGTTLMFPTTLYQTIETKLKEKNGG